MKRRQLWGLWATFGVGLLASLLLSACSGTLWKTTQRASSAPVSLTVSAAASLQDALEAIAPQFHEAHPDIALEYNFGASGSLQRQIEQGAPADVFFSAAARQMDILEEKDLILSETRQAIVTNRLVLIGPAASQLQLSDIAQLKTIRFDRLAVGEFRSVPAGQYAQQVFEKLNLLEPLETKFVFGKTVRSVLGAVESGSAEFGIVYATDAALSTRVTVMAVAPEDAHTPIVYPIAVVRSSPVLGAAQTFINFLTTKSAQATFSEFGFGTILAR